MKRKNRTILFIFLICCIVSILPSFLLAQSYDNIAFMKNVPKELRQKFPMCDEFLDVTWIDPQRYIGKMKADIYVGTEHKGMSHLIILSKKWGAYNTVSFWNYIAYGISKEEYENKDFEKFIREAEFTFDKGYFLMTAKKGNKKMEFQISLTSEHPWNDRYLSKIATLSFFTKNIFLVHPDTETAILAEEKKPFIYASLSTEAQKSYNDVMKTVIETCEIIAPPSKGYRCDMPTVRYATSIDMNYDGVEDFLTGFSLYKDNKPVKGRKLIYYSQGGAYRVVLIPEDCFSKDREISIKSKEKAVYYQNCSLTVLTKGGK